MKNLRPETLGMLKRIEALSGRPVEFKPDSSLTLRATMQLARSGAASHVLRYRPTNEPLDYWVAYQAGYLLRLLELPPAERFDFAGTGTAPGQVEELLATGQPQADDGRSSLAQFAEMTAHWALLNLRSYAIGMRIDQWLAKDHPGLRDLQAAGMDAMQQENLQRLALEGIRVIRVWSYITANEGFLKRIDQYLGIAEKHHIKTMFVLFDSCWGSFPQLGPQPAPKPHTHNSRWLQSPHIDLLKDVSRHGSLEPYVSGVIGRFPTCMNVGPAAFIQHTNFGAWLGPAFDFEPDGNAGLCPMFAPYDADECFADGDAGLHEQIHVGAGLV